MRSSSAACHPAAALAPPTTTATPTTPATQIAGGRRTQTTTPSTAIHRGKASSPSSAARAATPTTAAANRVHERVPAATNTPGGDHAPPPHIGHGGAGGFGLTERGSCHDSHRGDDERNQPSAVEPPEIRNQGTGGTFAQIAATSRRRDSPTNIAPATTANAAALSVSLMERPVSATAATVTVNPRAAAPTSARQR